jgi:transcriptional regulator with XRE-family HTH domain
MTKQKLKALQQRQKEWIEKNPLREFRARNGMTVIAIASLLGVSSSGYQKWETGAGRPSEDNVLKLIDLTGDSEIEQKFVAWFEAAPRA